MCNRKLPFAAKTEKGNPAGIFEMEKDLQELDDEDQEEEEEEEGSEEGNLEIDSEEEEKEGESIKKRKRLDGDAGEKRVPKWMDEFVEKQLSLLKAEVIGCMDFPVPKVCDFFNPQLNPPTTTIIPSPMSALTYSVQPLELKGQSIIFRRRSSGSVSSVDRENSSDSYLKFLNIQRGSGDSLSYPEGPPNHRNSTTSQDNYLPPPRIRQSTQLSSNGHTIPSISSFPSFQSNVSLAPYQPG